MTTADLPQFNILVVDDMPDNLRLLVGILTKQGYKVRPVPNGRLALSAAQGLPPDLILLDINMPGMNGYEVCQRLKADKRTQTIPVIFLSAFSDVFDKVKAFSVGGVDYITKPFQVEEVVVRIQTHLAIRSLQQTLQQKNQDLEQTLQELQATQAQLIRSEKMAALGQLVAGVAHEMNTPLGAIRSSVDNILDFLNQNLEQLPAFFQALSPERQQDVLNLLKRSAQTAATAYTLSSREKRQFKRAVIEQLTHHPIMHPDLVADTLVDIGVYDDIQPFLSLLNDPASPEILNMVYQLASLQRSAQTIATATGRAAKVVYALKSYAHQDANSEPVKANLIESIETALTLYYSQFKHGVEVIKDYTDLPAVLCVPDDLNQVWTNLIHNALQAMDYQGTLAIAVTRLAEQVQVSITDNGPGIAPGIQAQIFAPFYTTKPKGEGTGLGLSIVKKIVEKHQGTIQLSSVPGKTTFTVQLPVQP